MMPIKILLQKAVQEEGKIFSSNTYFRNSAANLRTIPEKSATFPRILSKLLIIGAILRSISAKMGNFNYKKAISHK